MLGGVYGSVCTFVCTIVCMYARVRLYVRVCVLGVHMCGGVLVSVGCVHVRVCGCFCVCVGLHACTRVHVWMLLCAGVRVRDGVCEKHPSVLSGCCLPSRSLKRSLSVRYIRPTPTVRLRPNRIVYHNIE